MSTEIKNTLFRFVTMRAPELSDEKQKDKRFIFRNFEKQAGPVPFDDAVALRAGKTKWNAMRDCGFIAFENENQLKAMNESLYDLAIWIARNKHSFEPKNLLTEIEKVSQSLDDSQVNDLWNNLFYQVVTQKDFYIKEIVMQMLVANHVIINKGLIGSEFDSMLAKTVKNPIFDTELIKNIVNAKVVLPKELFVEDENTTSSSAAKSTAKEVEVNQVFETAPSQEMLRVQELSVAQTKIQNFENLKKELEKVEKNYRKEYQKAYESAERDYQKMVKPIIDKYNEEVRMTKERWCAVRDPKTPYDENDPCNQPPSIPQPELPKFEFDFREEMNYEDLRKFLSEDAFTTLLDVLEIDSEYEESAKTAGKLVPSIDSTSFGDGYTYSQTYTQIANSISQNTQVVINNTPNQGATAVSINGVMVPVTTVSKATPFTFQICPKSVGIKTEFYLTFEVPDSSWNIYESGSYYNLVGSSYGENGLYFVSRSNNTITIKTQIGYPISDLYTSTAIIGEIAFSNGQKMTFEVPNSVSNSIFRSCFSGTLVNKTTEGSTNTSNGQTINTFVPTGFGVKQLGIADYKKVEQTTQGYVEGDVAHIENVMARERREKSTRKLSKSEITDTETTDTEREQITDTSTTNRFELQSEVAKVLQETKDMSINSHVDGSYGSVSFGVAGSLASHSSKEENTKQAMTQAQEVTAKATDRIVTKVHKERVTKMIEEFEENNLHEFDNRKGDKHVVGVYRWVDKVFKNQIYNFGKRLMFEFMVPEPAKLHLLGMTEDKKATTTLIKPVDPRQYIDAPGTLPQAKLQLKDYGCINETTAKYWGEAFNVELPMKLDETIAISHSFKDTSIGIDDGSYGRWSGAYSNEDFAIPENYCATSVTGNINIGGMHSATGGTVYVCGKSVSSNVNLTLTKKIKNKITVSGNFWDVKVISGSLVAECELTSEARSKWQQETFKTIIDAYQDALKEYNQKLAEEAAKSSTIKESNPGFYRQIENLVLRKNCISYIIDQNTTANRTYGKPMSNGDTTFGGYEVKVGAPLDDYSAFVKFMEQAFEWDIMSYNFYPYYWGDRQDWSQLYQYDNNDPLFRSFMQAGMARVIVTVRPGFEEAVRYYMQTGQIWNGGEVPVIDDKLFLSIVDELRQPQGKKEGKAWATRLPTALTILQAQAIGLNVDKALPFDEDLSDFENTSEVPHSNQLNITDASLGGTPASTTAKLVGKIEGNEGIEAKIVLKNTDGSLRNLDYCDAEGSWEISDIPSGKYELLLDAEDDFPETDFEVLEGSKTLTVELGNDQTMEVNLKLHKIQ